MKSNILKIALIVFTAIVAGVSSAQTIQNSRRPMPGTGAGARSGGLLGARRSTQQAAPEEKSVEDAIRDVPRGTNGVPTRLAFDKAELEVVLYTYADVANRILIQAPNLPKTQITLKTFEDRSLSKEEYLNAIERELTLNGIVLEYVEDIYLYAFDRKTVRAQGIRTSMDVPTNAIPEKGKVISQLIRLRYVQVEEAQKALEGFKDPNGLFQVFERINAILVTDTQENVNRMLELIRELDVESPATEEVTVEQLVHATASEVKATLIEIVEGSKEENQGTKGGLKTAGAPGFMRSQQSTPAQAGGRLLTLNNRPGANKPAEPAAPTPNATLTAGLSDADRGLIRGKVLIVADDRSNRLIIITSKANLAFFKRVIAALDVPITPEVKVEVVRLKYAKAEDVARMLNDLIGNSTTSNSKGNQNQAANRTGTGSRNLSTGTASTPSTSARQSASNPTFSKSAAATLGELNKDNIKILADERINGVVVMARKEAMTAVKDVIEEMDQRLSQVLIETVIVQVELGDDLQTGIDWVQRGRQHEFVKVQKTDKYGRKLYWEETVNDAGETVMEQTTVENATPVYETVKKLTRDNFYNNGNYMLGGGGGSASSMLGGLMNAAAAASTNEATVSAVNPIGGGLNYLLKSDKLNIAAVLQASKSDSRTKVLASPIIMTVDNMEATIEATDMIYLFSGYQYSGNSYNGAAVRNYEKRDIGLTVTVKPHINPNGTVELEVDQTFETQGADQIVPGEDGQKDPYATVTTRKIKSDVSVENRQTVVMGGLTKKSSTESESGIPILKDIPWIGKWLFGSVSQTEKRSELLVFMTPYVLDEAAAAQAEAIRRKKTLSDARPWEDNGWSLSPVADPVARKEQLRRLNEEWARQDEERKNQKAIEEARRKRVRKLMEMDEADRKEWLETHQKEVLEEQERFDGEQRDLREIIDAIREKSESVKAEAIGEPGSEAPAAPAPAAPAPAAPAPVEKKD